MLSKHESLFVLTAILLVKLAVFTTAGEPEKVWVTLEGMDGPESVYYHPENDRLYVSNMAGDSSNKDGEGWISILNADGSVIEKKWVDGLNAPKGIRIHDGTLWVSDIDRILAFDVVSGSLVHEISVPDAVFLNDVDVGPDGTVYVSDMKDNKIYSYHDGNLNVFAEGKYLESPNGLLVAGTHLYVGGWSTSDQDTGHLYALDLRTGDKTTVTSDVLGNLDGLEVDGRGHYLTSDWIEGDIFRVTSGGEAERILDLDQGTADIGFIHEEQILLIPQNQKSKIVAYKLGSDKSRLKAAGSPLLEIGEKGSSVPASAPRMNRTIKRFMILVFG